MERTLRHGEKSDNLKNMVLLSDLFYVVHVQPVLSIKICSHLLQVNTARRDPITSSQTGVTCRSCEAKVHKVNSAQIA